MNIEIESKHLLKMHAVADECGCSIDSVINSALTAYLNRFRDSDLTALNSKAKTADVLASYVGSQSKRRAGIR
jgi:hypothetical protein